MPAGQVNVLLIEDNPGDVRLIQEMLKEEAGASFRIICAQLLSAGLTLLIGNKVDVILLDLGLPDSRGLNTFLRLQEECATIPIIVLTGIQDKELAIHAVQRGAQDYLNKGLVNGPLLDRSIRYAIERKRTEIALKEIQVRLEENLQGTIDIISETIERKGPFAPGHHQHVKALASAIALEMGLTDFQVRGIELAAAVYDIGLIHIARELLDIERLDGIRLNMYQQYPQVGHNALNKIEFPWPIADITLQHREYFDGAGFPQGIKESDILIEARVLAVADAVVDLTTHKSYRNAFSLKEALDKISSDGGSKYDPQVVNTCLSLFNEKGFRFT